MAAAHGYVDHATAVSWIAGLDLFGSGATDFKPFHFLSNKMNKHYYVKPESTGFVHYGIQSEEHWLMVPDDHWETRMRYLPQTKNVIPFQRVIECYSPNEIHLGELIKTVASAPNNSKIVAIMSENWSEQGSLTEEGHVFCAVWHRHPKGTGSDIFLHDVFSTVRLPLLDFFWKHFPKEQGHNFKVGDKRRFQFEHCEDTCTDGTLLNRDSCVLMTHLAAELELRNITPPDNCITTNVQKGYAAFWEQTERLRSKAVDLLVVLKDRMTKLAASNVPKKQIRFCILGCWYQTDENYVARNGRKVPITTNVIPLLMNYNVCFLTGAETKEALEDHLHSIVYRIEVSRQVASIGFVR